MDMSLVPAFVHDGFSLIEKHDIISFDIFDTLLNRPFAKPSHLFWLITPEIHRITQDPLLDFSYYRIKAEEKARDRVRATHGYEEITLDEIYEIFAELTLIKDTNIITQIKQAEIDAELYYCYPREHIKLLYHHALEYNKKVILTSDMYLPEQVVKELVTRNGYTTYDHLFLSSTLRKTKHCGTIYPHIIEHYNCAASDILHIGDNKHPDVHMAQKNGLTALHVRNQIDLFFDNKRNKAIWKGIPHIYSVDSSITVGLLAEFYAQNKESHNDNYNILTKDWESFGYNILGNLCFGFIIWLIRQAHLKGIKKLYFLSRDGKIMKEVYDMIAPYYNADTIESHYLYLSRRALQIARINNQLDTTAYNYLISSPSETPCREYIERIGLTPENYEKQIVEAGFATLDSLVRIPHDMEKIRTFFYLIREDIFALAKTERETLNAYFKQEGLLEDIANDESIAMVDIGWTGGMLFTFNDFLKEHLSRPIEGFYIGTHREAEHIERIGFKANGFLFERAEPGFYHYLLSQSIEIVELLFTATHGSVVCFEKKGKKIEPVLCEVDLNAERIKAVEGIQKGALNFVKNYLPILQRNPIIEVHPYNAVIPLGTLFTQPTYEETFLFKNIIHIQHIGNTDLERPIVPDYSAKELLFKPFNFAQKYRLAYWKKGFEKRMGCIGRLYFRALLALYMRLRTTLAKSRFIAGTIKHKILVRLSS